MSSKNAQKKLKRNASEKALPDCLETVPNSKRFLRSM